MHPLCRKEITRVLSSGREGDGLLSRKETLALLHSPTVGDWLLPSLLKWRKKESKEFERRQPFLSLTGTFYFERNQKNLFQKMALSFENKSISFKFTNLIQLVFRGQRGQLRFPGRTIPRGAASPMRTPGSRLPSCFCFLRRHAKERGNFQTNLEQTFFSLGFFLFGEFSLQSSRLKLKGENSQSSRMQAFPPSGSPEQLS